MDDSIWTPPSEIPHGHSLVVDLYECLKFPSFVELCLVLGGDKRGGDAVQASNIEYWDGDIDFDGVFASLRRLGLPVRQETTLTVNDQSPGPEMINLKYTFFESSESRTRYDELRALTGYHRANAWLYGIPEAAATAYIDRQEADASPTTHSTLIRDALDAEAVQTEELGYLTFAQYVPVESIDGIEQQLTHGKQRYDYLCRFADHYNLDAYRDELDEHRRSHADWQKEQLELA